MNREAFEAWLKSRSLDNSQKLDAWGRLIYKHTHIQAMHEAWQAALAHANVNEQSQAQQTKIAQLKMIEIQDVLEALDADKTKGELVNGNFDDNTIVELPNLSHDAAKVIRFLLQSQAQQESLQIGKVQHFAAPEGAPVYVTVQWKGSPPKHGAKVYALPPAPEGGEK